MVDKKDIERHLKQTARGDGGFIRAQRLRGGELPWWFYTTPV